MELLSNAAPLGTFSMLFLGKQLLESTLLESTYIKLLVALAKMSAKIRLYSLSNVSLRSRNSKTFLPLPH